jgi:hypothetical protein
MVSRAALLLLILAGCATAPVKPAANPDDDRIDAIVAHDGADVPAEGLATPIPCHRCRAFGGHGTVHASTP